MKITRRDCILSAASLAATMPAEVVALEARGRDVAEEDATTMAGVFTALFTPFKQDYSLNEEMLERLVEFGIANGVKGFYLTGGTGEGLLMSVEERAKVYKRVVRAAHGRVNVIAHVGCIRTSDAVSLARAAADAGCDWVSSMPPVYYGVKPGDILNHYRMISEATDLPFMIYASNGLVDLERDARAFDLKNVMGMKYTGTDFYSVQRLAGRLSKKAVFFSGSDQHMIAALSFGDLFCGAIGTVQNIVPAKFVRLFSLMRANDVRSAASVQREINRIVETVCHTYPKHSLRKAAMRYIGFDCGQFRPPHEPYTEEEYRSFAIALAKCIVRQSV